jgi:hypothetical protein
MKNVSSQWPKIEMKQLIIPVSTIVGRCVSEERRIVVIVGCNAQASLGTLADASAARHEEPLLINSLFTHLMVLS